MQWRRGRGLRRTLTISLVAGTLTVLVSTFLLIHNSPTFSGAPRSPMGYWIDPRPSAPERKRALEQQLLPLVALLTPPGKVEGMEAEVEGMETENRTRKASDGLFRMMCPHCMFNREANYKLDPAYNRPLMPSDFPENGTYDSTTDPADIVSPVTCWHTDVMIPARSSEVR
jgi:hypothetical protein